MYWSGLVVWEDRIERFSKAPSNETTVRHWCLFFELGCSTRLNDPPDYLLQEANFDCRLGLFFFGRQYSSCQLSLKSSYRPWQWTGYILEVTASWARGNPPETTMALWPPFHRIVERASLLKTHWLSSFGRMYTVVTTYPSYVGQGPGNRPSVIVLTSQKNVQ